MKTKNKLSLLFSVLVSASLAFTNAAVLSLSAAEIPTENNYVIADHNNATLQDLQSIPDEWLNKAQDELHIAYWHTSHGSQVTDGMAALSKFLGSKVQFTQHYGNYDWASEEGLDLRDCPDGSSIDLGNANWSVITDNYLTSHPEINTVMWSWCGQVGWSSESDINKYLTTMTALEEKYPNITFVYMTGHLDGSGVKGNLNLRNEQIRKYCKENNKVLFDFADIESYDPDGNYYLDKRADDGCNYDSNGDKSNDSNWAQAWQNSHKLNVDWFDCSAAHSEALNGNMKSYAAWYLWANIAGYNSNVKPVYGDLNSDGVFNIADAVNMKKYLLGNGNDINPSADADINDDGKVNSFDYIIMMKNLKAAVN